MKTTIIQLLNFDNQYSYWSNLIRIKSRIRFKNRAYKMLLYPTYWKSRALNYCSHEVNVVYDKVRGTLNDSFAITKSRREVAVFLGWQTATLNLLPQKCQ